MIVFLSCRCPRAAGPADEQPGDAATAWILENERRRKSAKAYAHSDPYDRLCVMCQALAPMHQLMARMLTLSGQGWKRKQLALAANGETRSWVILEAAKLQDVTSCMKTLLDNMHDSIVASKQLFVPCSRRLQWFAMTSAGLCGLHVYLRMPRQQFPYKLFLLLEEASDSRLQEFIDCPPCMWDELSTQLLTHFGKSLLDPEEGLAVLQSLADIICVDVANIEAAHSSTREFSQLRSKGWTSSLQTISSRFVLQQRQRAVSQACPINASVGDKRKKAWPNKRRRGGGGGAWRAFASFYLQGRQITAELATAMSTAYRQLSDEDRLMFQEAGAAATIAHRQGFRSFAHSAARGRPAQAAILRPGDVLPDGVVVAADDSPVQLEELAEFAGDTLAERYTSFKEELAKTLQAQGDSLKPTAAQEAALARFNQDQSNASVFGQQWAASGFADMSASLSPVPGATSSTVKEILWCPPVEKAVKDRIYNVARES